MRTAVLLSTLLFIATSAAAADDPAVAVRRFFHSWAAGEPLDPFWAAAAPGRERFERAAYLTHRSRCLELASLRIDALRVADDSAAMRVTLLLTARERATGRTPGPSLVQYEVALARAGGEWRIAAPAPAAESLADSLIAAPSESARRALLDEPHAVVSPALVRALHRRAIAASNIPKLEEALRISAISNELAGEIGDPGGLSLHQSMQSIVARMQRRTGDARAHGAEALALAEKAEDPDALVRALISAARSDERAYVMEQSLQLIRQAIALEERVEDLTLIVRALVSLEAEAWTNGDYVRLRQYLDREMALATLAGDAMGHANALHNLAVMYDEIGDTAACVAYAKQAVEALAELSPGQTQISALMVESRCRRQQGQTADARVVIERALAASRRWKNQNQESWALAELAEHHLDAEEFVEAERMVRESLCVLNATGAAPDPQYGLLALALLGQKRHAEAIEAAGRYVENQFWRSASRNVVSKTLIAKAHRALGDTAAALAGAAAAVETSEQLRDSVAGDARQRAAVFSRFAAAGEAHVEAVDLHLELGRVEEALAYAERAKARVLLDTLGDGRRRPIGSMIAAEAETEERLEAEIATLNRRLLQTEDPADRAALTAQLERVRAEYVSFQSSLYARHPRLKAHRGHVPIATPRQMIEALPPQAAFVEYVVGVDRTQVFVVSRASDGRPLVRARTLPVTRRALEQKVAGYRAELAGRALDIQRSARELDALLLEPIEDFIGSMKIVGIVPDAVLWQLPFEALVDRRGRYRLERHTIFYAPSVSVLLEMRNSRTREPRRSRATLMAVGDPLIAAPLRTALSAVYRSNDLAPLPDARAEVEQLRRIYGRDDAAVFLGAAATEANVKAEIGGYEVLHFATHGILDDSSPMYSRLVLTESASATGADADGLLEAWELMKLDLNADLVVMSSCDSARGHVTAGEGIIGLTWAAFVAGARTTVASLWKVASTSTSELMIDFHRALRANGGGAVAKAEALRRAKLRMLRNRTHDHPFYWAPFVVMGDPGSRR